MVDQAFMELSQWFGGLVRPIRDEYNRGIDSKTNRKILTARLAKLASKMQGFLDDIAVGICVDLKVSPIKYDRFVSSLISEAWSQ